MPRLVAHKHEGVITLPCSFGVCLKLPCQSASSYCKAVSSDFCRVDCMLRGNTGFALLSKHGKTVQARQIMLRACVLKLILQGISLA